MTRFHISIGSNIEPARHIPACLEALRREFPAILFSAVYETEPVGPSGVLKFWNLCAVLDTPLNRTDLEKRLHELEKKLGRVRNPQNKFAPRVIDLDLLPQSGYEKQAFIIVPLAEIDPDGIDPVTGCSFKKLAEGMRKEAESFRPVAGRAD